MKFLTILIELLIFSNYLNYVLHVNYTGNYLTDALDTEKIFSCKIIRIHEHSMMYVLLLHREHFIPKRKRYEMVFEMKLYKLLKPASYQILR